jgi:very-short-patch-repair endonuclease
MDLASILLRNDGFAARATLYAAGFSKHRVQRELAAGNLIAYGRDIVGSPRAAPAFQRAVRMRCRIACVTAAKAAGLWVLQTDAFHVVPRTSTHPRTDDALPPATVHWSPHPLELDRSRLAIESGRNALAHVADCEPRESAVATFDSAVRRGVISLEELGRLARVRGGRFAQVVALVSPLSDSGLESITRVRLAWEGVSCREQVVIDGHPVDLLIGDRLVIQLDGRQHGEDLAQLERDRRQDRRLRRMGYTVLRFGYADIIRNWDATWAEIRAHLAQRAHLA